jgi:hypothetical protein
MPDNRPAIPADTQLLVCTRAGHKCSVDGVTSALEIAHIIDWAASHDDTPENLLLLCANCHTRSHKEKWSRKTLRYYRDHPFVNRGDARAYRPTRLPYPSLGPLFKGREDFLIDLRTSLEANFAAAVRGHTVHGMGGVGKTRAAVEYAWRFAGEYTALLFVEADSPESLSRNLAALSAPNVLDLPQQHEPEQAMQEQAVMRWLQTHPGWLLIIDNADTKEALFAVEDRLAQLRDGHVIITTRRTNCSGSFESLDLGVLTREDATDFLLARTEGHRTTTPDDDDRALVLADLLDGLALALEQAAAYIRELRLSFADYITRWQSLPTEALAWHDEVTMHYPRSLAITYQTSINQLSDPAREFFRVLAWFAPDPIPFFALDSEDAPYNARALLAELENLSLTRRNDNSDYFSLHRLVQEITRQQQTALLPPPALIEALSWINGLSPNIFTDVQLWPIILPVAPHVQSIAIYAAERNIPEPTAYLLNQVAILFHGKAQHAAAESFYRQSLSISQDNFGSNHPEVTTALNNLAELLQDTNQLAEAEPLIRQALAIDEAAFGSEHPNIARSLDNLARLCFLANRMKEAEPLIRRALAINEVAFGSDHPDVARLLGNLAGLLQQTNRLEEAEPLIRRALAINEASLGSDHLRVSSDLNNLAMLLQATNRMEEAEPLIRRSLAIEQATLGANHPNVALRLNNLAWLLQATDRRGEAEPLMRHALKVWEVSLGENHPQVATCLNNLALLLWKTNRLVEAEPLMRRQLEIFVACTDATEHLHRHLETAVENYSRLLIDMGDKPTLAAKKTAEILEPIRDLILNRSKSQQFTSAMPKSRPTVTAYTQDIACAPAGHNCSDNGVPSALSPAFNPTHPEVATQLNNLYQLLIETNRLTEAEPLMRRTLSINETSLGPTHPDVGRDLNNLAALLMITNRFAEAEPLMRRALEIFVEFTRASHHPYPDIQDVIKNYRILLMEIGEGEFRVKQKIAKILKPIRGIIS